MTTYDHFHCTYEVKAEDGTVTTGEIEGGLAPKISEDEKKAMLNAWSEKELEAWKYDKAVAWGMPEHATIVSFTLAG